MTFRERILDRNPADKASHKYRTNWKVQLLTTSPVLLFELCNLDIKDVLFLTWNDTLSCIEHTKHNHSPCSQLWQAERLTDRHKEHTEVPRNFQPQERTGVLTGEGSWGSQTLLPGKISSPKRVVRNSEMRKNLGQKEFVNFPCYQFVFSFPNFFVPNLSITQPDHIQG